MADDELTPEQKTFVMTEHFEQQGRMVADGHVALREHFDRRLDEEFGKRDLRFDSIDAALRVHTEQIAALRSDVNGHKADVNGLKADVSELKADVSELKADVSELKSDVNGLKADVSELKAGMKSVISFLHRLDARLDRIERKLDKKADTKRVAELEKKLKKLAS